jgi:hypothetical protein
MRASSQRSENTAAPRPSVRRCWRKNLAFLDLQAGDRQSLALALHNDFGAIAALIVWSDGARAASSTTSAESTRPGALSAPQLSIVVLPFANLSGDPEQNTSLMASPRV